MPAPLTDPSLLGSLLADRYEIRAPLGRGGMGEVVEAVDRRLARTVAIKVLHPELADDERFLARFRREAATAARLSHVGIVSVHDIGEDAGRTFIVMELVAGRTLAELGRRDDASSVARIGAAAARALAHAHDRGVVHRDVSPANIMVTADGTVKVLDFGIARGPSATAASRGTVAYLAPEVLRGETADARADVYSLGMVLRELASDLDDRGLDTVLARATASEPGARFVSAADLSRALEGLSGASETATPSEAPDGRAGDRTEPIVRVATRPLATAVSVQRAMPVHAALPPARGIAVPRRSRGGHRAPRVRIARVAVTAAAALVALGIAVVLGQTVASMSSSRATASVSGPVPLTPPTGLVATASCDGLFSTGVDLTWTGGPPAKGYEIRRRGGTDGRVLVARVGGGRSSTFRDADLGVDVAYAYRVRALDGPRVSRWSKVAHASTPLFCLS
jgi:tRNA A-37 threonylcarbamoyl transferase component Bud32